MKSFSFLRYNFPFLLLYILSATISAQQTKEFTLENCVSSFNTQDTIGTEAGYQFWFVDKKFLDGRTLKMSVVKPGSRTHAPHSHKEDEFFFVLEGEARFYLDGDSVDASAYTSFYCPSGSLHGIANHGEKELKYLVIKKYLNP